MTDSGTRLRDLILVGLTFAAGGVDAVSYLGLGQIFTANMTGNTVLLALATAQQNLLPAVRSLEALAGFAFGALSAGRILGRPSSAGGIWPPRATWVLALEAVLLGGFSAGWVLAAGNPGGATLYALIAVSAFAMGLQAGCARGFALRGITTTVLTTALTGLMADFAALGISGPDQRRWTGVVLALFAGATLTGLLVIYAGELAPLLSTAVVGLVGGVAFLRLHRGAPSS